METAGEKETGSIPDEGEDIPSDFFDDFNKADFMEGLSVIDSWNDKDKTETATSESHRSRAPIDADTIESVKDLRELIGEPSDSWQQESSRDTGDKYVRPDSRIRRSTSSSRLDEFIKPGSRRDPSKTNEAIKRDKEEKVKELLAKQLQQSSDNLRPPGTELDDFYEDRPRDTRKSMFREEMKNSYHRSPIRHRGSPSRRRSPRRSPRRRSPRRSPQRRSLHRSPQRRSPHRRSPFYRPQGYSPSHRSHQHHSPSRRIHQRHSPQRRSPQRRSPQRRSPQHHSPQRRSAFQSHQRRPSPYRNYNKRISPTCSPRRRSPTNRSPHWELRSRSPLRRSFEHKSQSPYKDHFLYPQSTNPNSVPYDSRSFQPMPPNYGPLRGTEFGPVPRFTYPQPAGPNAHFATPYTTTYGSAEPVMPVVSQMSTPAVNSPVPAMVPPPGEDQPHSTSGQSSTSIKTPYDALAQLVAEGKLSKEDYLKLAPNKGVSTTMDTKTRVMVLTRCSTAMNKLTTLRLPNRLFINNNLVGPEPKSLVPKFCSPLKRQAAIEFHFSKPQDSQSTAKANKQIIDSIISTLHLEEVVTKYKKKQPKDMKEAAVQTTKPYCDVCEIRESTKMLDASSQVDATYFTSTVHTQVLEQDLANSKSVFNPTGSIADGAPISIAHMTPAQLVSQLAARAKTLKQGDPVGPPGGNPNQYRRNQNYDYDGRGGQYQNFNNYRY